MDTQNESRFISLRHLIESSSSHYKEEAEKIKTVSYGGIAVFIIFTILPTIIVLYAPLINFILSISSQLQALTYFLTLSFALLLTFWFIISHLVTTYNFFIGKDQSGKIVTAINSVWGRIYSNSLLWSIIIMFYVSLIPYFRQIWILLTYYNEHLSTVIVFTPVQFFILFISIILAIPNSLWDKLIDKVLAHNESVIKKDPKTLILTVNFYNKLKTLVSQKGRNIKIYLASVIIVIYVFYYVIAAASYYLQYFGINLFYAVIFEFLLFTSLLYLILIIKSRKTAIESKQRLNEIIEVLVNFDKEVASELGVQNDDITMDYSKEYEKIYSKYAGMRNFYLDDVSLPSIFQLIHIYSIKEI